MIKWHDANTPSADGMTPQKRISTIVYNERKPRHNWALATYAHFSKYSGNFVILQNLIEDRTYHCLQKYKSKEIQLDITILSLS